MRFFYDSGLDILGIRFKPGQVGSDSKPLKEVMPGVFMGFDKKGNLEQIDIKNASAQQPDLPQLVEQLVQELLANANEMSQEALLAIEKTIRLGDDNNKQPDPEYQPGFSFDAINNVLVVDFFKPESRSNLMPKQQILPNTFAVFNQDGRLVSMDIQGALNMFPDLGRFVQQGKELQAMQNILRMALDP